MRGICDYATLLLWRPYLDKSFTADSERRTIKVKLTRKRHLDIQSNSSIHHSEKFYEREIEKRQFQYLPQIPKCFYNDNRW